MNYLYGLILLFICSLVQAGGCYESSILKPSPFMGNDGEAFKLADGSWWEVKYEYLYAYYPEVVICPDTGKLHIEGKKLNIQKLK